MNIKYILASTIPILGFLIMSKIKNIDTVLCQDMNNLCQIWGENGECHKNPDYMLIWCNDTCNVCT